MILTAIIYMILALAVVILAMATASWALAFDCRKDHASAFSQSLYLHEARLLTMAHVFMAIVITGLCFLEPWVLPALITYHLASIFIFLVFYANIKARKV